VGRGSLSVKKNNPSIHIDPITPSVTGDDDDDDNEDSDDQFGALQKNFDETGGDNRRLTKDEMQEFSSGRKTSLMKKNKRFNKEEDIVKFEDFKMIMVLGRGTFGKVFLAELPGKGDQKYAIKSIRKDVLIQMDQVDSTILEKEIMFECDHPFLVGMDYVF